MVLNGLSCFMFAFPRVACGGLRCFVVSLFMFCVWCFVFRVLSFMYRVSKYHVPCFWMLWSGLWCFMFFLFLGEG